MVFYQLSSWNQLAVSNISEVATCQRPCHLDLHMFHLYSTKSYYNYAIIIISLNTLFLSRIVRIVLLRSV